ncbi:Hypothetical predicted protein [Pelobates cultripes]|uniref:Uncharacterized protein n=1 Tax=Pelobates cultripes TaxID=61616 RepID=A0AAD1W098_PELCU|nr:Hypothetical predicted protein [Pelobates cultripes]
MGRRTKKYKAERPPATADIGELLRRPQASGRPEMAPMSNGISSSDKILADGEDYYTNVPTRPVPPKPSPAAKPPVTEDTLRSLLDELRRNIATIGQFREEINGVSARLQHTELNSADHENRIQNTRETDGCLTTRPDTS